MENNEFMKDICQQDVNWDSIDTATLPDDIDITPIDKDYESYKAHCDESVLYADFAAKVLDFIQQKQNDIRKVCEELNEGIFNSMKAKTPTLAKLDDKVVYQKIIDSTIKYKITHNFDDLFSLYKKLNDKDIRKFCFVEIRSMYVQQIRIGIANSNKIARGARNVEIVNMRACGAPYAKIAERFDLSIASVKKICKEVK